MKNHDTQFISQYAVDLLPRDIVESQTAEVDTITGATLSSMAILSAVQDCFDQAGGEATGEQAPLEIVDHEDEEVDVLVVGSGTAGVSAALAAATIDGQADRSSDLRVMVIEKLSYPGGSFILSGAGIATPYGSKFHESGELETLSEDDYVRMLKMRSNDDPYGCLNENLQRANYRAIWPAEQLAISLGAPFTAEAYSNVNPLGEGFPEHAWMSLSTVDAEGNIVTDPQVKAGATNADLFGPRFVGMLDRLDNIELRCGTEATRLLVEDGAVAGIVRASKEERIGRQRNVFPTRMHSGFAFARLVALGANDALFLQEPQSAWRYARPFRDHANTHRFSLVHRTPFSNMRTSRIRQAPERMCGASASEACALLLLQSQGSARNERGRAGQIVAQAPYSTKGDS